MTDYQKLCKKDCYNFISPYGLGDTLMLCGFHKAWEEKNKGKIHFIIQPSHEIVMKMYGIKNYTLLKFERKWFKEEFLTLGKQHPIPEIGKLYVAHPHFHESFQSLLKEYDSVNSEKSFLEFYCKFLDIPLNSKFQKTSYQPEINRKLRDQLARYGKPEDIILLLPGANSLPPLDMEVWLAEIKKNNNYKIIQNVYNDKYQIPGIPNIDMSVEDVLALSCFCKKVYSLRSGICDLIAQLNHTDFTVFYNVSKNIIKRYSLKKLFGTEVSEVFCEKKSELNVKNIYLFNWLLIYEYKKQRDKIKIKFFKIFKVVKTKEHIAFFLLGLELFYFRWRL